MKASVFPVRRLAIARPPEESKAFFQMTEDEITGRPLYVISDTHGHHQVFLQALRAAGLINAHDRWSGGKAILVLEGDLINKGDESLSHVLYVKALQRQAELKGGKVVVSLGNHEARLLRMGWRGASPEIHYDIRKNSISKEAVKEALDYLASLPLGAFLGDALFVHSGYVTEESYLKTLALFEAHEQKLRKVLRNSTGPLMGPDSLLEASGWQENNRKVAAVMDFAEKTLVKVISFGHQPYAFDELGIVRTQDDRLIKIDQGIGSGRPGGFLYCEDASFLSRFGAGACRFMDSSGAKTQLKQVPDVSR